MKLSEQTIKILKNFSGINPSILLRAGSLMSTQSIVGDTVAEANIEEEFPIEFALYDLQEFLNTLKLFSSPVLDFRNADNNYLFICEEDDIDFKVRYTFAKKEQIIFPKRRPSLGNIDISFSLDYSSLQSIIKASNVMQLPYMIVNPSDKTNMISIEVSDVKDKSSNKFSLDIEGSSPKDVDFSIVFKMENLKMIPADYTVGIVGKQVASFESDVVDYYIGCDVHSRY